MQPFARQTSGMPALLGLLAFWGGMVVAARKYPAGYDWQYTTMSSLVYANRNAHGFWWARGGMVLCGALGLYWMAILVRRRKPLRAPQAAGIWTLGLGYLCMTCCALLPERSLHIPRGHDLLALAAFLGLCIGTVLMTFTAVWRGAEQRQLPGGPWLYASLLAGLAFAPILLAALAQTYVSHALPTLPWVRPVWRVRGVPAYLSFAFWEWVTCAVLSLYLAILSRTGVSDQCPKIISRHDLL